MYGASYNTVPKAATLYGAASQAHASLSLLDAYNGNYGKTSSVAQSIMQSVQIPSEAKKDKSTTILPASKKETEKLQKKLESEVKEIIEKFAKEQTEKSPNFTQDIFVAVIAKSGNQFETEVFCKKDNKRQIETIARLNKTPSPFEKGMAVYKPNEYALKIMRAPTTEPVYRKLKIALDKHFASSSFQTALSKIKGSDSSSNPLERLHQNTRTAAEPSFLQLVSDCRSRRRDNNLYKL